MLDYFDFAREMDLTGVAFRMLLSVLCGGIIGIEREFKRRPAGFRTHILISLGACTAILTNLYIFQVMHLYTDVARLGAQVVAGIGFIGAGTIIVTKRQRVKGLTTAAGLWASAIIGLACGAGSVECAVFATLMVMLAELVLIKLEYRFARKQNDVNLFIEYANSSTIENIIDILKGHRVNISGLEINRTSNEGDKAKYGAVLGLKVSRIKLDDELIKAVGSVKNVISIEEI